jgi:hypothetical protein
MCFFHHSQPVKCKALALCILFFVFAFFSSSPLSPFLSLLLQFKDLGGWFFLVMEVFGGYSFYNNLCVEPSSNPKNFGAFHLVPATCVGSGLPKATRYIKVAN